MNYSFTQTLHFSKTLFYYKLTYRRSYFSLESKLLYFLIIKSISLGLTEE